MQLSEVIAQINTKAGFRRDEVKAKSALTLAITMLENESFLPWFLVSEYEHTLTVIEEERIPLPDRFLKGYEEGELFYVDEECKQHQLIKVVLDEATITYDSREAGPPEAYALAGKYFRVFPKPDKNYKMRMLYYKKSRCAWEDPENVNLWLEEAPRLAIAGASIILMEDTRDIKGMEIQGLVYQKELRALMNRDVDRKEINLYRTMGLN